MNSGLALPGWVKPFPFSRNEEGAGGSASREAAVIDQSPAGTEGRQKGGLLPPFPIGL